MSEQEPVIPVLFRADRAGEFKGHITAVFPTLPGTVGRDDMTCYAHIGQHSACTHGWYRTTRPATETESASLRRELEGAPFNYRLRIVRRITRAMDTERRAAAR